MSDWDWDRIRARSQRKGWETTMSVGAQAFVGWSPRAGTAPPAGAANGLYLGLFRDGLTGKFALSVQDWPFNEKPEVDLDALPWVVPDWKFRGRVERLLWDEVAPICPDWAESVNGIGTSPHDEVRRFQHEVDAFRRGWSHRLRCLACKSIGEDEEVEFDGLIGQCEHARRCGRCGRELRLRKFSNRASERVDPLAGEDPATVGLKLAVWDEAKGEWRL